jgi:hypothetical protein
MAIVRLGAHTPAANTNYVLYTVQTSYLASVIASNTLTSSTVATKVDIWVVPQGVSQASGYAYITSNLEVGLGQSFETFKFGVNAGDTVFVKSTTAGTSFVIQGMDQNNEYSINNVPITFTNKIIRGNDNIIYPAVGNTAERPSAAEVGYWRYNTDLNYIEFKTPTGWAASMGPTGPAGVTGATGAGLSLKGVYASLSALQEAVPVGSIGDGYLIGDDIWVWNAVGSNWALGGAFRGPIGPTGPSGGPTGATGPQGPTGPTGSIDNATFTPAVGANWLTTVYTFTSAIDELASRITTTAPVFDNFMVSNNGTTAYLIGGASNLPLTLIRGKKYAFTVNASGHPFYIKTEQVSGTGSTYTSGITNNGVSVGLLTFTVPLDAPNTLYYVCEMHVAMSGVINVIN